MLRGRLMAEADDRGSMIALVGADDDEARRDRGGRRITVANDNAPGPDRARRRRATASTGRGGRPRARQARHARWTSPARSTRRAMAPAVAPFRAALDETELAEPRFTVFSCATAQPFEDVRDELDRALTRPSAGARRCWPCTRPARRASSRSARARCSPASPSASSRRRSRRRPRSSHDNSCLSRHHRPRRERHHAPPRPRTARVVGLGAKLPRPRRAERPDRRAHRRRRRVDRPPHRHPERRHAAAGERTADLAVATGRRALTDAGLKASDVDLVLLATMSAGRAHPERRPARRQRPGQLGAAYDIGAACSACLAALPPGAAPVETGRADACS